MLILNTGTQKRTLFDISLYYFLSHSCIFQWAARIPLKRTAAPWLTPARLFFPSQPVTYYSSVNTGPFFLMYCIMSELHCDLFMLVHTVLSPAVLFMWRAYQWQTRPALLQGTNLPLPGRRDCSWVRIHSAPGTGACTHAHINKTRLFFFFFAHRVNSVSRAPLAILKGWMELSRIW